MSLMLGRGCCCAAVASHRAAAAVRPAGSLKRAQQCKPKAVAATPVGVPPTAPVRPSNTSRIDELVQQARQMKAGVKGNADPICISDLISKDATDGSTLQWAQLVMAGGGMLGIAHVGFVRMLEEAGVRFLGVGGTSSGAITAALIASLRHKPDDTSWEATYEILKDCTFADFEDGDDFFKQMRIEWARGKKITWSMLLKALLHRSAITELLLQTLGMHKGDAFLDWMHECMPVHTTEELLQRMRLVDNGIHVYKRSTEGPKGGASGFDGHQPTEVTAELDDALKDPENTRLKLVASEISTQSMVVFPQDADLFYALKSMRADPAEFVRASMSVPGFFRPFTLPFTKDGQQHGQLLDAGQESKEWSDRNGFVGEVPKKAVFVDGGTLSNFPMSLFHKEKEPQLPTLGVQLGTDRSTAEEIVGAVRMVKAMNNSSRHLLDRIFLHRNSAYSGLLATADTKEFDWLDFSMGEKKREDLLIKGMQAGRDFLDTWRLSKKDDQEKTKWEAYKEKRRLMAECVAATTATKS